MRTLVALVAAGLGLVGAAAVPTRPTREEPTKSAPPPITQAEAHYFANQVVEASRVISGLYVRPVSQHHLTAKALVALHHAAGSPIPELLQGDLEKALAGCDLHAEALKVRRALGNVPGLRGEEAIRVSLKAMASMLDPYSAYLDGEDWQTRTNQRLGIGLTLVERPAQGRLTVGSVTLGGPAAEKGLRPGDVVIEIDGQSTGNLSAAAGNERLLGHDGTAVTIVVQPQGKRETRTFRFERHAFQEETVLGVQRLETRHWDYHLDREKKLAFIRLGNLNEGTSDELQVVLAQLRENGLRALILDLRDCPGGLLDEATSVVQLLIPSGVVAKVKYREEAETITVFRQNGYTGFPMAVLVSPETSGGGELIAAALQDHNRAAIIGQRTRGKASIQRTPDLGIGGRHRVRLTVGYFHRPSGKNLHRHPDSKTNEPWGVQPDEEHDIRLTSALRQQIREWRLNSDLRPPKSREALPLDDPENDPVLQAARQYLERNLK
jgi:carboxyl-terminal processing protease